ncbi:MAG: MBL fold metallo-hydrolase [Caldithrix sp.]|nr:MAG: MBL fold metallo-hydrolase [Caldithrix sp.]
MSNRTAVSIVLTRDPDSTEIYLVERNPKLKFFGGFYACPGGTLDKEDIDIEIKNWDTVPQDSWPYIVAAARETFEETGILLTQGPEIAKENLQTYRKQLLDEKIQFAEILKKENQTIDAADFHFICSILTPEFSPVRYDTEFYWVKIPENTAAEIWQGELIEGKFISANEALTWWRKGEMLIVPPVIFMLKELVGRSVKSAVPFIAEYAAAYRRGKIHQVYFTPGVQLITLKTSTIPPANTTNTYLVGESQLYIIDPAPTDSGEQDRLWNYLDDRIKEGNEFKGILLTHHHSDHIGALTECQKRYDLPILAHPKTAEKLATFKFSRALENGDELDLGESPDGQPGWKLKVYYTPGHASGHLAFQESRYGAVIAGDLISTVSTIVISPPEGHMATYLRSLAFLESVIGGTIYPGHGPAVRTGKEVLQYFIKHRQEREQKLLGALSSQPQSTFDLVKQVYDDVDSSIWSLAEHSLQAHLIKLIEEGKCEQVGGSYRAVL